ncbi:MAG: lamin tail domain-containing protein [Ferruginibacter sp.]
MRKTIFIFLTGMLSVSFSNAQVSENFSDNDYTGNPVWQPSLPADWVVTAGQLQSNNQVANSSYYISTPNTMASAVQWEFYVNLAFNTSSANYVDVFLTASAGNLTTASGYYVRIGNTKDEICLYKTGSTTPLIDGVDATTNVSNSTIRIKVTRDANNQWALYRDLAGGTNYTNEGTATDATFTTSAFFGFLVKQSTASFFQKHFFDDIEIKAFVPDITAPAVQSSTVITANTIDVLFDEALDNVSAAAAANYVANNSLGSPATATLDASNKSLVHLTFASSFTSGTNYQLTINGVKDIAGNAISNGTTNFSFTATPPVLNSAIAPTTTTVDVFFDEPLESTSAQTVSNYVANNSLGSPAAAVLDAGNPSIVHLTFATAFANGTNYQLTVNGVKDLQGSPIVNGTATFGFYTPQQYDIVIDEIMADPTPQIGLPNNEWIELRNTSSFAINLKDWKVGDGTNTSGVMPAFVLQPDSFVLICTGSAVAALTPLARVISVTSFPSLTDGGKLLTLISNLGQTIHSVNYSSNWYGNELKKDGGWSLEMIDTKNPCSGFSNWKASEDPKGGTPGKKNSVDGANPDPEGPRLVNAYATDSVNLVLVFNEPLDAVTASLVSNFSISDGISISVAGPTGVSGDHVQLQLATPIVRNKTYTVTANGVTDCVGNAIGDKKTARVGMSEVADSLDVVINEILFNPPTNGSDYVELYNRSNKIIDLSQLRISDKFTSGSFIAVSPESYLLFPQEYVAVTDNIPFVKSEFVIQNPDAFVAASVSIFNDDKDSVILSNALTGKKVDQLVYDEKWHFSLISDREDVSLERIDPNAATQNKDNWHSAAKAVASGYGTPGYKNSQYLTGGDVKGEVKVSPEILSPDNDGQDDIARIDYNFPERGYVANITIFDAAGRPVKYLQKNALCGINGYFTWDGLGDKGQQLPTGIYVVYTEVFNLSGKKKHFKTAITLARRN